MPLSHLRALARRHASSRAALVSLALAVALAAATATRLVLAALHLASGERVAGAIPSLAAALAVGPVLDATAAIWLCLPFALLIALLPRSPRRWQRALAHVSFGGIVAATLFVAVCEVVFFAEFDGRFNFVAVDYLVYPTEVVTNIGESYPVVPAIAAIAAVTALVLLATRRVRRRALDAATSGRSRLALAAASAALAAASLAVPASLARVSGDRAVNEIAGSGYRSFWSALRGQDAPYDGLYASRPERAVVERLHHLLPEDASSASTFAGDGTLRRVAAERPARRLNVVVVLEESLGAGFVGSLHGGDTTLTPRFDSLAAEGTLLVNAYATGNRTIRALEATTASIPPLPGISIVRRPASRELFTLPALLRARGYATEFVYGGRAMFDGMGSYMRNNGVERVVEQKDFPRGSFTTAWGVADEAIFDRALADMDSLHAAGTPFYSLLLTVSNHRPYDYPAGRIDADPAARRRDHVVRYADWALGRFLREARRHAFFDSTLFVVMGDHGPRVYGAAEIPMPSYEVPILFYAPGIVPGGARVETLASSMDVPPTILGILGGAYDSRFFGRDVFRTATGDGRAPLAHGSEIALLDGDRLAVLGLRGSTRLFRYDRAEESLQPIAAPGAAGRELLEDAIAYYDGADVLYRSGRYRLAPRGAQASPGDD